MYFLYSKQWSDHKYKCTLTLELSIYLINQSLFRIRSWEKKTRLKIEFNEFLLMSHSMSVKEWTKELLNSSSNSDIFLWAMKSFFYDCIMRIGFNDFAPLLKGTRIQPNHIFVDVVMCESHDIKTASLAAWIYGRYMFSFKQISYFQHSERERGKESGRDWSTKGSKKDFDDIECICQQ